MAADFKGDFLGAVNTATQLGPTETGLTAVDLKSIAASSGELLDVSRCRALGFSVVYTIAGTTPTVGTVKLQAIILTDDGGTQLSEPIDIVTITSTQAAGTYRVWVAWSDSLAPAMQAYGSGGTFTIGTSLSALRSMRKIKLRLDVTTAYDQTGAKTASVYMLSTV